MNKLGFDSAEIGDPTAARAVPDPETVKRHGIMAEGEFIGRVHRAARHLGLRLSDPYRPWYCDALIFDVVDPKPVNNVLVFSSMELEENANRLEDMIALRLESIRTAIHG